MSHHFNLTAEFQKCGLPLTKDDEGVRLLLVKIILHCADLSNPARFFEINFAIADRVQTEFKSVPGMNC